MYKYINVYIYISIYMYGYFYVYIYIYIKYICTFTHWCICTRPFICIHILLAFARATSRVYTCIYTYIHVYTRIYTHSLDMRTSGLRHPPQLSKDLTNLEVCGENFSQTKKNVYPSIYLKNLEAKI